MATAKNQLIALLPQLDRLRLIQLCVPIELTIGSLLGEPGDISRFAYFPIEGFISLVTLTEGQQGQQGLEVGMVGREGMAGVELALGSDRSLVRMLVQGSGSAWRLGAESLREQMEKSAALRQVLQSYILALLGQLNTSAACQRFHLIGARLARWLLMTQDRSQAEHFDVTQEFLAYMLGVRRVSVTAAASLLQRQGLIRYSRGHISVLDRPGLEAAACSCYACDLRTYADSLTSTPERPLPSSS